jgi:hypothetical protein
MVSIPEPVEIALRNRIGKTNPEIADGPLPLVIRYAIAVFAGFPDELANRAGRVFPRGNRYTPIDWNQEIP